MPLDWHTWKSQQTSIINGAYEALPEMQQGFSDVTREGLFAFAATERDHRRTFGPRPLPHFSVVTAARLHLVRWLARYATGETPIPTTAEYLEFRPDVFLAGAIAAKFGPDILAAWRAAGIDPAQVIALDYGQMMETRAEWERTQCPPHQS